MRASEAGRRTMGGARHELRGTILGALALTLASCVGFVPGIEVSVVLVAPRAVIGDGLSAATIAVEEVELVRCEGAEANLLTWPLGRAFAHGAPSDPHLIDLRHDPQQELDRLAPEPGRYCGIRLHLGTPTDDAAMVRGEVERRAARQDVILSFREPREYVGALVDEVTIYYDPRDWMLHGDFNHAFELGE